VKSDALIRRPGHERFGSSHIQLKISIVVLRSIVSIGLTMKKCGKLSWAVFRSYAIMMQSKWGKSWCSRISSQFMREVTMFGSVRFSSIRFKFSCVHPFVTTAVSSCNGLERRRFRFGRPHTSKAIETIIPYLTLSLGIWFTNWSKNTVIWTNGALMTI